MYKRQKAILLNFVTIVVITAIVLVAMMNFKDYVNRSEAMLAMEDLAQIVGEYRERTGAVPPESYVERAKEKLQGHKRLGELRYRARWIDFESSDDEILAYTELNYNSLIIDDGVIVLRLDGRVEWIVKQEFEPMLIKQQSQLERQMLK